jgi:hypothetical protein
LNAEERLEIFMKGIERYVSGENISSTKLSVESMIPDCLESSDLEKLTQDDCFNYSYALMQYADHIGSERAKTNNVLRWCENTLQSIISDEISSSEWGQYDRHETKVATILRNNLIALKVNEWKMVAESRLEHLQQRDYNVRRKADILMEKGKRK